jgi:hypothetical protein
LEKTKQIEKAVEQEQTTKIEEIISTENNDTEQ